MTYPPVPPAAEPAEPNARRSTAKVTAIIVIALLVLGGSAVGLFFVTRDDGPDPGSPDAVREAYMQAYEDKDFSSVVRDACKSYLDEFGTNTSRLEDKLEPYDVTAEARGEPKISGDAAEARIDLELARRGDVERPKIVIQIVKEAGEWKFCGESRADAQR